MRFCSFSASEGPTPRFPTPMVPRRTRMVTKPQRMVILRLLKVFWIWRPRGRPELRRVVVGRVAAAAAPPAVLPLFTLKPSWPIVVGNSRIRVRVRVRVLRRVK